MSLGYGQTDTHGHVNSQQHPHPHAQLEGDETTFNAAIDSMFLDQEPAPDAVNVNVNVAHTEHAHTHEHAHSTHPPNNSSNHNNKRRRLEHNVIGNEPNHMQAVLAGPNHTFDADDISYQNQEQTEHQQQQQQQQQHNNNNQQGSQEIQHDQQQMYIVQAANFHEGQQRQLQVQAQQHHHQQQHPRPIIPAPPILTPNPVTVVQETQLQMPPPLQPILPQPQPQPQTLDHSQQQHPQNVAHSSNNQRLSQGQTQNTWTTDHVSEARRRMNILIQRQQQAHEELKLAEEALRRAHVRVEVAKKSIDITRCSVNQGTEELTDALLQEPTNWNAMYRKLKEFKFKHGHVDVRRTLNDLKSKGLLHINPEVVKLGTWIGRVRLEARRPAGHVSRLVFHCIAFRLMA